jgi:hypothetical protein
MAEENLTIIGDGEKPKHCEILKGKKEEQVVMGLKHLMALGDALLCIEYAKDTVILTDDTVKSLASLIIDKTEQVWNALEDEGLI